MIGRRWDGSWKDVLHSHNNFNQCCHCRGKQAKCRLFSGAYLWFWRWKVIFFKDLICLLSLVFFFFRSFRLFSANCSRFCHRESWQHWFQFNWGRDYIASKARFVADEFTDLGLAWIEKKRFSLFSWYNTDLLFAGNISRNSPVRIMSCPKPHITTR